MSQRSQQWTLHGRNFQGFARDHVFITLATDTHAGAQCSYTHSNSRNELNALYNTPCSLAQQRNKEPRTMGGHLRSLSFGSACIRWIWLTAPRPGGGWSCRTATAHPIRDDRRQRTVPCAGVVQETCVDFARCGMARLPWRRPCRQARIAVVLGTLASIGGAWACFLRVPGEILFVYGHVIHMRVLCRRGVATLQVRKVPVCGWKKLRAVSSADVWSWCIRLACRICSVDPLQKAMEYDSGVGLRVEYLAKRPQPQRYTALLRVGGFQALGHANTRIFP